MAKSTAKKSADQAKQASTKTSKGQSQSTESKDFDSVQLKKVEAGVERARKHLKEIRTSMPWLGKMDTERRRASKGKFRDGEDAVLLSIAELATRKEWKEFFRPLAKKDKGEKSGSLDRKSVV